MSLSLLRKNHSSFKIAITFNILKTLFLFIAFVRYSKSNIVLSFQCSFDSLKSHGGDEENRTPDPLLARQVLSQLSYTPMGPQMNLSQKLCILQFILLFINFNHESFVNGLKWTRTTDLTLIRRAL